MPRHARVAPGGYVYHVMNRAAGRNRLFRTDEDFAAFERLMAEAWERHPIRILSWCLMSNHWHFVVHPRREGELTAFFRWLTHTHAVRWRAWHSTAGQGPVYQGRFKSFMVQRNEHLLTVCRHVERNPLTAGLVKRSAQWRWSSLWTRERGDEPQRALLCDWPVERPAGWAALVDEPLTAGEIERLEVSERRGRPYGDQRWVGQMVRRLGLLHTVRPEGRPRKER